jgi:ribosomal protein S6--L-glutamate ligase
MCGASPIVSYNPALEADRDLLLTSQRPLGPEDEEAIGSAGAVLLPQVCRRDLWHLVTRHQKPHFPNPKAHLNYSGKVGNLNLFKSLGLPTPLSLTCESLAEAEALWQGGGLTRLGLEPPLVFKGASGGEGQNVYLVHDLKELGAFANSLETSCVNGPPGLVLQEYVECRGRDVRVIIMGKWHDVFWRIGRPGEFRANLSQGGRIERKERRQDLERALDLALSLQKAAEIDLAAVDILVPEGQEPLLLEINFYFGRQALGGGKAFLLRYLESVRHWLSGLGLDPGRVRLSDDM